MRGLWEKWVFPRIPRVSEVATSMFYLLLRRIARVGDARSRYPIFVCQKDAVRSVFGRINVETYASSKPVIASLIPSEPNANVPYGNLFEPDTLLSSETFSDSSLSTKSISEPMSIDGMIFF
jgi:hypothetical protein